MTSLAKSSSDFGPEQEEIEIMKNEEMKNVRIEERNILKGILEEMARSSNVRFDVEDKSKNARDD